jgi:hypothetical protein
METTRIERALRQGPPEPQYREAAMGLVLARADRRRASIVASFTRLGVGIAAAVVLTAAGVLILVALLRPPGGIVGGLQPTGSPTLAPVAASPTRVAASPTNPVVVPVTAPPSTPTPTGTPAPSSSPGATATGQCDLTWAVGRVEGAAGSRYINVDAVNHGSGECAVGAMLSVTLTAADGNEIATGDSVNPQVLQVPPGGQVTGFVQWTNWCQTRPPTNPLTLTIHANAGDVALQFSADQPPCNAPGRPSDVTPLQLSTP